MMAAPAPGRRLMLKRSHRDVDLPSLVPPQFASASEARKAQAPSKGGSSLRRQPSNKWDHALLSAYMVESEAPRGPTAGLGLGLELYTPEPEFKGSWSCHGDYMNFLFGGDKKKSQQVSSEQAQQQNPAAADGQASSQQPRSKRQRVVDDDVVSPDNGPSSARDASGRVASSTTVATEAQAPASSRAVQPGALVDDAGAWGGGGPGYSSPPPADDEMGVEDELSSDDGELDADAMELVETDRAITVGAKEFAAKTKLRRGFFARALKRQLEDLREENARLKKVARECLDDHERVELFLQLGTESSNRVIEDPPDCGATEATSTRPSSENGLETLQDEPDDARDARMALESIVAETNRVVANPRDVDRRDLTLVKVVQQAQRAFVITNPALPDNPIVWASDEFAKLTGYTRQEVCGRNCRFLQGPRTNPKSVDAVRRAIDDKHEASVVLLNYRKDGSTFWNRFFIAPLRDSKGRVTFYVGVQTDVSYAVAGSNNGLLGCSDDAIGADDVRRAALGGNSIKASSSTLAPR